MLEPVDIGTTWKGLYLGSKLQLWLGTRMWFNFLNWDCYFILLAVRLVGESEVAPLRGRVEIFYNGSWGRVCGYGWDLTEAKVVCRQLGFERTLKAASQTSDSEEHKGKIWMNNVGCTGRENSLKECWNERWGVGNCNNDEDASVVCNYTGNCRIFDAY